MLKKSIILGTIAIVATTVFFLRHNEAPPNTEASAPPGMFHASDAQWASLKLAPVEQKTFHTTVKTDGKIAGNDDTTTPVFSPYSGRVTKLFAKAGDHVERGDPLMAIAAPDFVNARAQLKLAITNEKRQHDLYDAKSGSLKDWQQAQADLETAKGNFRMAESAAKTKAMNNDGADAIVVAPISGTVTQRQVGIGQYINSAAGGAANPAFSIGDLRVVWLLANVRETDAPSMRVNEPVEVHVLAFPDRVFKAKLIYVAPSIDPGTHRLPVRAEVENIDGALKPEMFASFSIITDEDTEATAAIPAEAVIYEGENAHVWVAQSDDKLIGLRPIHVGRSSDGEIEVLDGLKTGEMVVTSGSLFIDRAAKADDQSAPSDSDTAKPMKKETNEEQGL